MLAPTHSIFGVFLTLIILAVFGVQWSLHWSIMLIAIFGAIVPDIDHPRSIIGRLFSFISVPLERRYGHRTITHSLVGLVIISMVFGFLILFGVWLLDIIWNLGFGYWDLLPRWIAAFSISYFSHLVLDMFNPHGSQMFWPDTGRDVIPKNPKLRIESGSKTEILVFFILLILMVLALPISKYGIASSLRWLLATPGSAIEEFRTMKTHAYLDFNGIMNETRSPIAGKGEILDVNNKRLIILYKDAVYTLSDELAADIIASHVRVKKTAMPIKTNRREFNNASREYLLSQIPKGALISGIVHLPEGMEMKPMLYKGDFKTIEQKGNNLILNYASRSELSRITSSRNYGLENKKDQAELLTLTVRLRKIRDQMREINSQNRLTPLGRQILGNNDESSKQDTQLAEFNSQLEEVNVRIEELRGKINDRKLLFSGEVYIRQ